MTKANVERLAGVRSPVLVWLRVCYGCSNTLCYGFRWDADNWEGIYLVISFNVVSLEGMLIVTTVSQQIIIMVKRNNCNKTTVKQTQI